MRQSTTWLKSMLRRTMLDDQIVDGLERAGIEIEQFISSKPIDEKVVVGLVKKVVQHPGADRLKIATVDNGREELQIVCGAPNVREGLLAPLAQIGAVLPDGDIIKAAKLRGEASQGMLCSPRELGLGDSHEGLLELPDSVKVGTPLRELYPADGIVDIKTPANRFDLLGATGLAREVAAMTDNELVLPPIARHDGPPKKAEFIADLDDAVKRFVVAELSVKPDVPTPDWMVARLAVAGIRSLGLLVDVTNYIMLETAQPLHAYDAAKVTLPFGVRRARAKEKLETLDGTDRSLYVDDLVITDGTGPIGLAGVRGGATTEITPGTSRIYLEAASFEGAAIRLAAKRHNVRTDASARFERDIPPEATEVAIRRAIALLEELAEAKFVQYDDKKQQSSKERTLKLSLEQTRKILGFEIAAKTVVDALGRLGIEAESAKNTITATLPWWRPDLKEAEDLIEEIVRVVGYDAVPSSLPVWRPKTIEFDRTRPMLSRLRELLSGAGLFEVMTYSFVSAEQLAMMRLSPDEHLALKNPLSSEQAYLRTSLLASHLAVLERNRTFDKTLELYELSAVFEPRGAGEQPNEPMKLGIMAGRTADSYRRVKGLVDAVAREFNLELVITPSEAGHPYAPGRAAEIWLKKSLIGVIGQLDPALVRSHKLGGEVAYAEIDVAAVLAAASPRQFKAGSRFPAVQRDIAVVIPTEVTWQAVMDALAKLDHVAFTYMSDYAGTGVPGGHKSLAFHVELSHDDRTPTDAEADDLEAKIRSILHRTLGAQERA